MLERRSEDFAALPRDLEALLAFAAAEGAADTRPRPLPELHHCPFLGLVGAAGERRVGCLLHPTAEGNGGVDLRGLSHYGGLACRVYFCPSHRRLPVPVKRLLRTAAEDWYDYGLTIVDTPLISAFFAALARRLGGPHFGSGAAGPAVRRGLREFLALRGSWPHRPPQRPLCRDPFSLPAAPGELELGGCRAARRAPLEALLGELGAHFESPAQRRSAEERLTALIDRLAADMQQER
jgi:hypothetical protein